MLAPTSLLVSRYRAFAAAQTLPLRPLTLLFGANNAGKSALARTIAILGSALDESQGPTLSLMSNALHGGTFADIAWQGEAGDYTFDLGLRWDSADLMEARYTFDGGGGRAPYVKELVLRGPEERQLWSGRAPPGRSLRSEDGTEEVSMLGLVPTGTNKPVMVELAKRMTSLSGRLTWLDALRGRPPRLVPRPSEAPVRLLSDGANAAELLIDDAAILKRVQRFYSQLQPRRELELTELLDLGYRLTLNSASAAGMRVEIQDTGEGMIQVLPVLVASAIAARQGKASIVAIEEPESHLHPDAQRLLAAYLAEIASAESPPIIILETHSRIFLLALQLLVAKGELPSDRVSLVWIEQDGFGKSSITPVTIQGAGTLGPGWPPSALAEDFRISAEFAAIALGART